MYRGRHEKKQDLEKLLREYENNEKKEDTIDMIKFILIGIGITIIVICLGFLIAACIVSSRI